MAWADSGLATVQLAAGELEDAAQSADRAVHRYVELGDRRGEGWGRIALAQIALALGEPGRADADARAALVSAREVDDERNVLWALEVIVEAALARDDAKLAARAWGVTQPLRAARGIAGSVIKLSGPAELHAALRAALGDEEFDACFRAGRDDPAGTLDAIVDGR